MLGAVLDLFRIPKYLTPDQNATGLESRRVSVPQDNRLRAALYDTIAYLTAPEAWEAAPGGMTETDAASVLAEVLESMRPDVGTLIMLYTATIPDYVLLCDGSYHLKDDYPLLWAAIHPWHKDPLGFTVPDFNQRFPLGVTIFEQVGGTGGSAGVGLTVANLPPHSHTFFHDGLTHEHPPLPTPVVAPGEALAAGPEVPAPLIISGNTGSAGQGEGFSIMPPFVGVRIAIVAR